MNGTQTNFPVLIYLSSDSELAAKAQDDGDDILFTSSDGTTRIAHEIELYDNSTGKSIVWVNVTSLNNTSDTVLYIYYNNSAASNQQNPAGVWDTNYKLVQHLNESCSVASCIKDSTSNDNRGTPYSGGTITDLYTPSGKIDGADYFDGTNDYIDCGNDSSLNITYEITIAAWVKPLADGWTKKKPITISGSTSALTDYQVKVVVDKEADMQSDYDDLRFVDTNGNILSYWIENYTATSATAWAKVPSIPTSGKTIYMYYGNPSASSTSNGTATFEFFDDFEIYSGWSGDTGDYASATVDSRTVLKVTGSKTPGVIFKDVSVPSKYIVEIEIRDTDESSNNPHPGFIFAGTGSSDYQCAYFRSGFQT